MHDIQGALMQWQYNIYFWLKSKKKVYLNNRKTYYNDKYKKKIGQEGRYISLISPFKYATDIPSAILKLLYYTCINGYKWMKKYFLFINWNILENILFNIIKQKCIKFNLYSIIWIKMFMYLSN